MFSMAALHAERDDVVRNIADYIPQLRRYALALTRNTDEADELVQESLSRMVARRSLWRNVRRPRAYLFSILHNVHVDRRRKSRAEADNLHLTQIDMPADIVTDPTLAFDLTRALRQIPRRQRQVILLIAIEGLSYRETASALRIPIGTVMSRLSRGRSTLRRLLRERGANGL